MRSRSSGVEEIDEPWEKERSKDYDERVDALWKKCQTWNYEI